ncbi:MAG: GTP-binding protein [Thermosynechococcus sp. Uc]|uniref:GTP-binding protein n=1 Tax=Thermosynechococcus sp. Uc TaxID=3034853 RepID=UPI00259E4FF4|nr:GTP-binding protein [Thermosynechococcus sp. Uc]MDM7326681.1 GTP-binding protein [Thermosynechococcus sp. Uc]
MIERSPPNSLLRELQGTIEDLEDYQSALSYQAAKRALEKLLLECKATGTEKAPLARAIADLEEMLDKLHHGVVHIAVFGMVGRGKSSLLNALLGEPYFATGPIHGVTQEESSVLWQISAAQRGNPIRLIDTPGLDEVNGAAREQLAREVAAQADLILFVIAGDLTRLEYQALSELRQAGKPMILVFNKVDQYPEVDREAIYIKIRDERVKALLSPEEIVMVAAAPLVPQVQRDSQGRVQVKMTVGAPQVEPLKQKILEVLQREGKALIALNSMLFANKVSEELARYKLALRDQEANQLIWKGAVTKALAIALNPITVLDMVSSAVIDLTTIQLLSRLYDIELTDAGAKDLLQTIALAMGSISLGEFAVNLGLSSLKGLLGLATPVSGGIALGPYLSVAMTQAGIAGLSSYTMGQVAKTYFANGAGWGSAGPKTVVRQILSQLDQRHILNRLKLEIQQQLYPS